MKMRFAWTSAVLLLSAAALLAVLVAPAGAQEKACGYFSCTLGCCDQNDVCHTEHSPEYCGYWGEPCAACAFPEPYCVDGLGWAMCMECGFMTCPFGCCDNQGACHDDQSPDYCGYYGEACVACELPTPYCFNEGVYAQCTPCNVLTCPNGCCAGDGYCHTDHNNQYCGLAGHACQTCGAGTHCADGECVPGADDDDDDDDDDNDNDDDNDDDTSPADDDDDDDDTSPADDDDDNDDASPVDDDSDDDLSPIDDDDNDTSADDDHAPAGAQDDGDSGGCGC